MSLKRDWVDRWKARTVVCIASGPSLTEADCETVRAAALPTIVTNTTFRMCPWADVLMAYDAKWWRMYRDEVAKTFRGERIAYAPGARSFGVPALHGEAWFRGAHNSGASAITLAIAAGAARVVMLGYDCQKTGGRVHWHGDHPAGLGNAMSMRNWPTQFKNVARYAAANGVPVVNASRVTALTCFPRADLVEALQLEECTA
jgi:hypothetical protein